MNTISNTTGNYALLFKRVTRDPSQWQGVATDSASTITIEEAQSLIGIDTIPALDTIEAADKLALDLMRQAYAKSVELNIAVMPVNEAGEVSIVGSHYHQARLNGMRMLDTRRSNEETLASMGTRNGVIIQ